MPALPQLLDEQHNSFGATVTTSASYLLGNITAGALSHDVDQTSSKFSYYHKVTVLWTVLGLTVLLGVVLLANVIFSKYHPVQLESSNNIEDIILRNLRTSDTEKTFKTDVSGVSSSGCPLSHNSISNFQSTLSTPLHPWVSCDLVPDADESKFRCEPCAGNGRSKIHLRSIPLATIVEETEP